MIIVRFTGGLGNQMFQYAFAKSIALKRNTPLKIDLSLLSDNSKNQELILRTFDLDFFNISDEIASKKEINKFNGAENPNLFEKIIFKINRLKGNKQFIQNNHDYDRKSIDSITENTCIIGRWQSEDFFNSHRVEIKKIFNFSSFTPNKLSLKTAQEMKSVISVGVHVRRGDYVSDLVYAKQIGALDKEYFENSMKLIVSKLKKDEKIRFYFISDDIDWCKNEFKDHKNIRFVTQEKTKNGYLSDFWLLSQCKHLIISNSTFSWWAAWLGEDENIIIAPKNWNRNTKNSPLNIIPKRWLKFDNGFEKLI